MSFYQQDITPTRFVELQRELLYDGPHEQETRVIKAEVANMTELYFNVKSDRDYLLCSDVFLEVTLDVQKQQIDGIDRERQRIHQVPTDAFGGSTGMAFADRTKRYVPVSVPIAHRVGNNANTLADLVDPEQAIVDPSLFVGIHACDGLALQQNIQTAHLTFKTVSIDEKLSEYLPPLIQLHGDRDMDRLCEGSGRGLTQFSEDKRDSAENVNIIGNWSGGNVWTRMHNRNGQRRIITADKFTKSATWIQSTKHTAHQDAEELAQEAMEKYQDQYQRAIHYIQHPEHMAPAVTYDDQLLLLGAMQADDILGAPLNEADNFQATLTDYSNVRNNWENIQLTNGLISWLQINQYISPCIRVHNTYLRAGWYGYSQRFYQLLVSVCQNVVSGNAGLLNQVNALVDAAAGGLAEGGDPTLQENTANNLCTALINLVEEVNNIDVLPYWYFICYLSMNYGSNNHPYIANFLTFLDDAGDDMDENVPLIELWCYQQGLSPMVKIIYFAANHESLNVDLHNELLVPQNVSMDWYALAGEPAFAFALLLLDTPWSAGAITAMEARITGTAADINNVDGTYAGTITELTRIRDLVFAQAQVVIDAAAPGYSEVVVPRCTTEISYMEPLSCFHFKPHPEYNTGVFKNRSKVLFDMDEFRLRFRWCKNLSRRLFNTRQCTQDPRYVGDEEEAKGNAATHPTVFSPSVLQEIIAPRTNLDNGAAVYQYWYPRLEIIGVKSAYLHTRWIVPKAGIQRPIGFKFPMLGQRTWKLGRVELTDGTQHKLDFKDIYFHRRPHFLVFHAKPAYDDDEYYDNKELLQQACKGCRFEGIRMDIDMQYRAFDISEEGLDKSEVLHAYTRRNYPMVNCSGLTLGMRQIVCLSASDISFRHGSEKVPVQARGHVRVSSGYKVTGPAGEGNRLQGHGDDANPILYDAKVDIYMTEYSRSYLEVGDTTIRHFIK